MKTLKSVRQYLNSIPNINSGGCAVAALAMYKWLEQNGKLCKTTKICFASTFRADVEECDNYLNSNKTKPVPCAHAFLYHRKRYIDTNSSDISIGRYPVLTNNIKKVKKSVKTASIWNHTFNRDYIKDIEKTLNINIL